MVPILVKGDDVISETKDRTGVNGLEKTSLTLTSLHSPEKPKPVCVCVEHSLNQSK